MLHSPIGRAFETLLFQTPRSDYLQPSPTPTFLPYGDVDEARLPDIQGSSRLKMVETPHTSGSSRTISRTRQARELNCSTAIKASPNTSVLGQCMTIAYTKVQNNKEGFKMLKCALSCLRRNQKWMLYIQIPVQNGKDPEAEYEVLTELWERLIEYGIEERRIGDLVAVDVDRYAERKKTSRVGSSSSKPNTKRTKPGLSRVSRIHPQQCSVVLPTVEKLTLRGSFRKLWGINFASLTTLILDSDLLVDECTRIFRSCVNLETLAFRLNDELPFVQYNRSNIWNCA